MKTAVLALAFLVVSSFSFGQNKTLQKKEIKISKLSKEEKDIKIVLRGNESSCEIIQSLDKQLQNQGLKIDEKQLEKLGVYLYNVSNPNVGDDVEGNKTEGKKFRIKFSLRLKLKDGKLTANVNLDICIDTEGKC